MKLISVEKDQALILSGVQGAKGDTGAPGVQQVFAQATTPTAPAFDSTKPALWFDSSTAVARQKIWVP